MLWFHRKPKNRRLARERVLDVSLRSSQVRAARMRLAAIVFGGLFAVVFGLYVLWRAGDWALDRFIYENNAFAIQELDAESDGVLSVDQIKRWAGVRRGQNLLALDLGRVKRNLELVPMIQTVSVERILPRTLRIRVVEREPVAQVSLLRLRPGGGVDTTTFQLDRQGYVMLPASINQRVAPAADAADPLPWITGIEPAELQPGRRLDGASVKAALKLLAVFDESSMAELADLKRIDLSNHEVLDVTTGQGSEITFGFEDFEKQLRRWRLVHEAGQKAGKAIASLDLAVTNNTPARWADASAISPTTPVHPKLSRSKKNHV